MVLYGQYALHNIQCAFSTIYNIQCAFSTIYNI